MNSGILLYPDGRPVLTKPQAEAETARRFALPNVAPLFNGPHPMLDEEGRQDSWDKAQRAYEGDIADFERQFNEPFVRVDEHADFSQSIVNTPGQYNDRFVKRNPISELDRPRDIYGVLNLSMRMAEDHYIVNRAIKVKKNFALREMQVVHKNDATVDFYTKEFRRLKMRQILSHVFRYHEICGRIVVYWGYEFPLEGICLLDPRYIVVRRFLNKTQVLLKPHPSWVSAARNPDSPEYRYLQKNLPSKWMKYVKKKEEIPLDDETFALIENDLSLFETRGLSENTISGVPLSACMNAVKVSMMLMAGDFSTAWMMKNLITIISIGDPNVDDYTPPDQIELSKLQKAFQRPEYALVAYTDPTVNIRFFSPGAEAMSSDRYKHSTEEIEYVMGIPGVFTRGEGSYAAGQIGIKPFREDIVTMRNNVVDQLFTKLLPIMREGYTAKRTGGKNDPDVVFDENCLKDDAVLFNELTGKWDRGAISNRALLAGRHGDFDMELAEKKAEAPYKEVLQPLFDVAHGDPEPSGPSTPTNEGSTGHQQPRPSAPR